MNNLIVNNWTYWISFTCVIIFVLSVCLQATCALWKRRLNMKLEDISVLYFCQRFCLAVVVYAMQLSLKWKPHFANRKIAICTKRSEINHWGTWHLRAFLPFCSQSVDWLPICGKTEAGRKIFSCLYFHFDVVADLRHFRKLQVGSKLQKKQRHKLPCN